MSEAKRDSTQPNFWPWLVAAWLTVVILYTVPMQQTQPGVTLIQALARSVTHWSTPALMCIGGWWLTGRLAWPPRSTSRFLFAHLAAAVVFSTLWFAVDMTFIIRGLGTK